VILGAALAAAPACGTADNALIQDRGASKDNWWDALPRPAWNEFPKVLESQGWFEVHEIRPGLFAIYEPGQFEEVISYLVVGTEKALLFDTGLGIGDMRAVVAELTELEPIVVNSHTHYDHVGGNHQFQTVCGTASEYTAANAKGRKHEDVAEFVGEGWIWKKTPEGFDRDRYEARPSPSRRRSRKEVIDLGGRTPRSSSRPDTRPTRCASSIGRTACSSPATFYPRRSTRTCRAPTSPPTGRRHPASPSCEKTSTFSFPLNEPLVKSEVLFRMRTPSRPSPPGRPSSSDRRKPRVPFDSRFSILTPDPLP
jgi:hypothetical protein